MTSKSARRNANGPPVQPFHNVRQPGGKQPHAATVANADQGGLTFAWLDKVWALFGSQRLAFILILALALASLIGVLLVQAPAWAQADSVSHARWLTQVQPKYGGFTDAFNALGLFEVFGSWWFRLLITMLAANILVCTIRRTSTLLRSSLARPKVVMPEVFFERAALNFQAKSEGQRVAGVAKLVQRSLRSRGYRVVSQGEGEAVHLYADKNRFAPLGSLLHHASFVMLMAGFVIGNVWGINDSAFVVAEGQTRPLGDTGLAVRLDSFVDEYYPEGPPKDYRSQVTLLNQGQEVAQTLVRVNSPLVYGGVRLHQSFFGPATVIQVRDGSGALIAEETVPLAWNANDRPLGSFLLPGQGLEVYVVGPASAFIDSLVPPGQIKLEVYRVGANAPLEMGNITQGQSRTLGSLEYTFVRERMFSGFKVVQDPGRPVLWLGAVGIVVGLMWVLYFTHRQVWVVCKEEKDGSVVVKLGAAQGKHGAFLRDFQGLCRSVSKDWEKAALRAAS